MTMTVKITNEGPQNYTSAVKVQEKQADDTLLDVATHELKMNESVNVTLWQGRTLTVSELGE